MQLPLPRHLDERKILNTISVEKDVDGMHALNIANLACMPTSESYIPLQPSPASTHFHIPCTALGCLELLKRYKVKLEGSHVVIIGRSALVGMPLSTLLTKQNATVTLTHSHTKDLPALVGQADIVVVAIGKPEVVRGSWLKRGAVVLDVGINYVAQGEQGGGGEQQPARLVGDVAFEECREVASLLSPVPGMYTCDTCVM